MNIGHIEIDTFEIGSPQIDTMYLRVTKISVPEVSTLKVSIF
jgi:hypothetical protein